MKANISGAMLVVVWLSVAAAAEAIRPGKPDMGLIEQTCSQTQHPGLCLSSLKSDPNSFPADKTGLALVALRLVSSNASDISEGIKVMLNDTRLADQPGVQQGLYDCLDEYLDASQQLDDSIAALLVKAYGDVDKWVNAAVAAVRTCEASFSVKPSVLTPRNDNFIKLCQNALTIAHIAETEN
ncbi:pectinesterase inhibitor-like [Momordica charantia]|uniref:Pectinesterase inhibitor-like n=1 Tax=Momordica charantia TaxID=3673 RepID=A0A6J1DPW6_MOMCH|nr:pectinesterase inhibitor-like [Momordica charantia]